MDAFLLCFIYLSFIGIILCKSEKPLSCHVCRSDKVPECADDFGGRDNRFLEQCKNDMNQTVMCRKEINEVFVSTKGSFIHRYCYYTDGFIPKEELEFNGVTYWTCQSHGCNGQLRTTSAIHVLGVTTLLLKTFLSWNS